MYSQGLVPFLNKLPIHNSPDFLSLVSDLCDISLVTGGCMMCFFIRNKWKISNLNAELSLGNSTYAGSLVQTYVDFAISWICPVILTILSILVILDKFVGLEWLFG
jgi:NSS family neurotransmitter:Na+ symporter